MCEIVCVRLSIFLRVFLTRANICVVSSGMASKCSQIPHVVDIFSGEWNFARSVFACSSELLSFLPSWVRKEQKSRVAPGKQQPKFWVPAVFLCSSVKERRRWAFALPKAGLCPRNPRDSLFLGALEVEAASLSLSTGIQTAQTAGDKFLAKRFPLENTVLSKTYLRDIIFDGEVLKDSFQLVSFK